MPGYIKVYRNLQDNWIWQEKPYSKGQAWVDMIFRCNHRCIRMGPQYQSVLVKRGSFLLSNVKLAEAWGWDEKTVRRFISNLVKLYMIKYNPFSKFSIYEIVKYAEYQSQEGEGIQSKRAEQKPSRSRSEAEQKPTNKNVNNDKNNKKIIYTPEFEKFFNIYPNQFDKDQTFKNWNALIKKNETIEVLMKALNNYIQSLKDNETEEKYFIRSTNFLGRDKKYKGFVEYKKSEKKTGTSKIVSIPQKGNFEQREYTDEFYSNLYKNNRTKKAE